MLTVILTRHGHTERSEPDTYLGQRVPASLTERGRRDAQALADRLRSVPIDRIISSPMERAFETAAILAAERGIDVEKDARMSEFDYGSWEGMALHEVEKTMPHQFALYDANPAIYHVGGGENGLQVSRRTRALVDEIVAWWAGEGDKTCVLVGHSSVNRALLATITDVPLADYRRRFQQDWVNLTVLRWSDLDQGPLILLLNDLAHVRGAKGVTWD